MRGGLRIAAAATLLPCLLLSACGSLNPYGPDLVYSENASDAVALQVPPDLTDVSDAEQFILPGNRGGALTRNTLLPNFDAVRFERSGAQSWLQLGQSPEAVWPMLLGYLRHKGYAVAQTRPVNGMITTQWQATANEGRLRSLVGGDSMQRIAFRLERMGDGSRLFARSQLVSADMAESLGNDGDWPAASHSPEATSELLADLLVYVGAEEQKARGIISAAQAERLFDDAELLSTTAGNELLIHRGFEVAYSESREALDALGYEIRAEDDGIGRIRFFDGESDYMLVLAAEHVSAVRARIDGVDGSSPDRERQRELLEALRGLLV